MISMDAFMDEMTKIAAQKCRTGSSPIKPENLAGKHTYDGTGKKTTKLAALMETFDESVSAMKTAGVGEVAKRLKSVKPGRLKDLALLGVGGAGALAGDQAVKDWQLGRGIRQRQDM